MATDIGVKVGVDGEAAFKQSLKDITAESKALAAEMKAIKSDTDGAANAESRAKRVSENLTQQIELQQQKIQLLREKLEESKKATGEHSSATSRLRTQLANAETTLNSLQSELAENTGSVGDLASAEADAGENALTMGDMIKANLLSDAIKSGLRALADLAKEAASALYDTARGAAEYADEYLTMSTVTGLSTEQLQEFGYMAELVDVSLDTMTGSMSKMIRSMSAARSGTEKSAEAFNRLGVKITNEDGTLRDSSEVFFEIIDALGEMEEGAERDALAMEIFGRSAQDLNPLIKAGSRGMAQFAQEAHDMGYVLDEDALAQLGALDDSFQRLESLKTTLRNRIGIAMAPSMERVIDKLIEMAETVDWDRFGEALGRALEVGADKLIGFVENVDLDKLADTAARLAEAIVDGITFVLEHSDEILALIGSIGTMLIGGKVVGAGKNAWGMISGFFGGGAKAAGAGAASGGAAAAGGGGAAAGGGFMSLGPWAAAALPFMEVLGVGKGAWDYIGARKEALATARLGADASIAEMEANVERLRQEVAEAQKFYDSRQGEIYGYSDDGQWLLSQATAELDAKRAALDAAEQELAAAQAQAADDAGGELQDTAAQAGAWGEDMIYSFVDGIERAASSDLLPALIGVGGMIAGMFKHSEPDVGPLSDDSTWMPDMMASWAAGIRRNQYLVTDALDGLAGDMAGGFASPRGGVNMGGVNVVIYGAESQSAEELYEVFSSRLEYEMDAASAWR